jgi:hypothetical protein
VSGLFDPSSTVGCSGSGLSHWIHWLWLAFSINV